MDKKKFSGISSLITLKMYKYKKYIKISKFLRLTRSNSYNFYILYLILKQYLIHLVIFYQVHNIDLRVPCLARVYNSLQTWQLVFLIFTELSFFDSKTDIILLYIQKICHHTFVSHSKMLVHSSCSTNIVILLITNVVEYLLCFQHTITFNPLLSLLC